MLMTMSKCELCGGSGPLYDDGVCLSCVNEKAEGMVADGPDGT